MVLVLVVVLVVGVKVVDVDVGDAIVTYMVCQCYGCKLVLY